jgi:hypothetical protein
VDPSEVAAAAGAESLLHLEGSVACGYKFTMHGGIIVSYYQK